ncbi:MAG: hypothetical protein V4574_08500 [Pseudomonadota bacterium]
MTGPHADADDLSRVIMLLYGQMDHGGPFWCYVAIKPSMFDAFRATERLGEINLYDFDAFGEVIVSAEGEQPPDDVTEKVAEMYGSDPSTFFQPIDPIAEINKKIEDLIESQPPSPPPSPPPPESSSPATPPSPSSWVARVSRRGAK